jgi:hypothetical protein
MRNVLPLSALPQSSTSFSRVAWSILDCAQPSHPPNPERAETRSYPRRAHSPINTMTLPSSLASLSWKDTHVGLRAAVERGPSEGARSGSTGPTWVPFRLPNRARSASRRTTRLPFSSHALREHRRSSTSIPSFDQRVALARPGTLWRIAGLTFALPCIALSAIR